MNPRCLAPSVAVALALAAAAPAALASPTFPGEVQNTLGTPCVPPCVICHATSLGGLGTAVRPFGLAVRERGAHAGDTAELRAALELLEAEGVDSNQDGIPDVAELREGRNPNDAAGICGLQYGCATGAPRRHGDAPVAVVVLIGLWARRRSRATPRSCRGQPPQGLRCRSTACTRSASGTCATRSARSHACTRATCRSHPG